MAQTHTFAVYDFRFVQEHTGLVLLDVHGSGPPTLCLGLSLFPLGPTWESQVFAQESLVSLTASLRGGPLVECSLHSTGLHPQDRDFS